MQSTPQAPVDWQATRLTGQDALAVRASRKLRHDDLLVTALAGTMLRAELDRIPLWRGEGVAIKQLIDDFARYLYLPRLKDPSVLLAAIREGLALLTWEQDSFAYADRYDDAAGRYRELRSGQHVTVDDSATPGLLVKPEVARRQMGAEQAATKPAPGPGPSDRSSGESAKPAPPGRPTPPPPPPKAKRFHGSVALDPHRVGARRQPDRR